MTDSHSAVKENWSLYRSGKITLAELLARNGEVALKSEVKEVMPREVRKAQQIFAPKSERGAPADKDEGWEH